MSKPHYFPALDGLRTIACGIVLISHLGYLRFEHWFLQQDWYRNNDFSKGLVDFFLSNGGLGVHLFFVLSGFLITYLLLVEGDKTGTVSVGKFYLRRALRIWPVYFIVIAFVFLVYPIARAYAGLPGLDLLENGWYYIAFLGNFDVLRIAATAGNAANSMSAVTWSVSIEEQFYLFWPWLFLIVPRSRIFIALITVILVALSSAALMGPDRNSVYFHTVPNLFYLALGGLMGSGFHSKSSVFQRLQSTPRWIKYGGLIILTAIQICFEPFFGTAYFAPLLFTVITGCFCALLLMTQMNGSTARFSLARVPLLVRIGKYTYGLYMYHQIISWGVSQFFNRMDWEGTTALWLEVLLSLSGSLFFSWVSFHWFERWFLNQKNKLSAVAPVASASRKAAGTLPVKSVL